jgi:hypothetical protein
MLPEAVTAEVLQSQLEKEADTFDDTSTEEFLAKVGTVVRELAARRAKGLGSALAPEQYTAALTLLFQIKSRGEAALRGADDSEEEGGRASGAGRSDGASRSPNGWRGSRCDAVFAGSLFRIEAWMNDLHGSRKRATANYSGGGLTDGYKNLDEVDVFEDKRRNGGGNEGNCAEMSVDWEGQDRGLPQPTKEMLADWRFHVYAMRFKRANQAHAIRDQLLTAMQLAGSDGSGGGEIRRDLNQVLEGSKRSAGGAMKKAALAILVKYGCG